MEEGGTKEGIRPYPTVLATSPAPTEERGFKTSKTKKNNSTCSSGCARATLSVWKLHHALAAGFSLARPVLHCLSLKKFNLADDVDGLWRRPKARRGEV